MPRLGVEPEEHVGIGYDEPGRLLEVIAIRNGNGDWLIKHAQTPPQERVKRAWLREDEEMSDRELCKAFGTTLDEVASDVEEFENGAWEGFEFGKPVDGKPGARMRTTSLKFCDFELAAIDAAAKSEGISRSAFIRRACRNELVALARSWTWTSPDGSACWWCQLSCAPPLPSAWAAPHCILLSLQTTSHACCFSISGLAGG